MAKKILLVEDEELLRDIYKEVLEGDDFEVEVATDGEEAAGKLAKGGYDLVLLDLMLPKRDGKQLLEDLKNNPPKEKIETILCMTNLAEEGLDVKVKDLCAQGVVVKSQMTPEEFLAKVKSYL
jgi:DNA-binding response OmpR family regulator